MDRSTENHADETRDVTTAIQTHSEFYCLSNADGTTSIKWKASNQQYVTHLSLSLIQSRQNSANHRGRPEVMSKKSDDSFAS